MDPGTLEVVELVLALVVKIALAHAILRWDERRLARRRPELLRRAWPPASRLSAIVVFQEIGVLLHFWRTRRWGIVGLALGLAATFALVLVTGIALQAVDAALAR